MTVLNVIGSLATAAYLCAAGGIVLYAGHCLVLTVHDPWARKHISIRDSNVISSPSWFMCSFPRAVDGTADIIQRR